MHLTLTFVAGSDLGRTLSLGLEVHVLTGWSTKDGWHHMLRSAPPIGDVLTSTIALTGLCDVDKTGSTMHLTLTFVAGSDLGRTLSLGLEVHVPTGWRTKDGWHHMLRSLRSSVRFIIERLRELVFQELIGDVLTGTIAPTGLCDVDKKRVPPCTSR